MANESKRQCNWKLALGIALAMTVGAMVTIAGFALTVVYQFTTGNLYTAPPSLWLYLVLPALGALIALAGSLFALRKWLRSRNTSIDDRKRSPGYPAT